MTGYDPPMRAIYAASVGGDDPLANLRVGDVAEHVATPGEAVVTVKAASLNHHDLWTLRGVASRPVVPPQVLGCDAAGVVERYVGDPPAGAPKVGARVVVHSVLPCGECHACLAADPLHCGSIAILSEPGYPGALAETLSVPAANLIALPDAVDFAAAACLPTAYLTAYRALFVRAQAQPGMTVLVHGATGGVSTAALVLCRAAGINTVVSSRDMAKGQWAVQTLGAVAAVGYDRDATKTVLNVTNGRGVDAVLDTVGEPAWELSLRAVMTGGTIVVCGTTGGPNPPAQLHRVFWRHLTVAGSSMGTRPELDRLVNMCAQRDVAPLIDSTYAFDDAPAAFAHLAAGEQRGKVVITV